jgi:hypothetical protein
MPNGDNSVANRLSIAKPLFADRVRGCNQQFGKAISTKNHVFTFGARSKYRLESISSNAFRTLEFQMLSKVFRGARKLLITTNCIDNAKKIRWGIRLHPFFDTIEFRICDAQSPDDTMALAALMQAIVAKSQKQRRLSARSSSRCCRRSSPESKAQPQAQLLERQNTEGRKEKSHDHPNGSAAEPTSAVVGP